MDSCFKTLEIRNNGGLSSVSFSVIDVIALILVIVDICGKNIIIKAVESIFRNTVFMCVCVCGWTQRLNWIHTESVCQNIY